MHKDWNDLNNTAKTPEKGLSEADFRISQCLEEKGIFLDLSGLKLQNLPSNLGKLTQIQGLNLSSNNLSSIDLPKELTGLRGLNISNNKLENVKGLSKFKDLELLLLSNNNIFDITPLKNLTYLREIDISANNLLNLSGIENAKNLMRIKAKKIKYLISKLFKT